MEKTNEQSHSKERIDFQDRYVERNRRNNRRLYVKDT